MNKVGPDDLLARAKKVLGDNDQGTWTVPAVGLYPHQWLWDSCFIAIGLRHLDIARAKIEISSLLRGQWSNGMLPNIIFDDNPIYRRDREVWRSRINPFSPDDVATSGITQPPMLAEAITRIGQKLATPERRSWYKQMYPSLLAYHQWLYGDRNPHKEGLIILLHPYESGLDNSPPWVSELRKHSMPLWVSAVEKLHLDFVVNFFRRDTRHLPAGERVGNVEALAYWAALRRLRRKAYNSEAILAHPLFAVEDLAFNCILIRANALLREVARTIGESLPGELSTAMQVTESALNQLWDEASGQYYSRSFISHKLIEQSTVSTLLPLYAGSVSQEQAARLVGLLKSPRLFGLSWPVPSVPRNSPYFDPIKYWQGPSWININWLIIDGLQRYGFTKEAELLRTKTLLMLEKHQLAEYFNPLTGAPAGATNFSWTAALAVDLLKSN